MKKLILLFTIPISFFSISKAQPGELDPLFGVNGIVTIDPSIFGKPLSTAIQSDGKVLLAGNAGFIKRYNVDGSPDVSFGNDGTLQCNPGVLAMAIQSNDKFVLAGEIRNPAPRSDVDFVISRYNSDGTPDNSFSNDGEQITDYGVNTIDRVRSVSIQSDGKIVLAGQTSPDFGNFKTVILRYNVDGTLDNSFSGDGKLTTDLEGFGDDVSRCLVIQADGKIVVAGYISKNNSHDFAIDRYTSNGLPDNTFDGDGLKIVDLGYDDIAVAAAIQADGKIVVSGHVNYPNYSGMNYSDMCVIRLNTNGSLDNSFSNDGVQIDNAPINNLEDYNLALTIDADGKIFIAGIGIYGLTRYNTDGTLDNTFSEDGQQLTPGTINDLAIFNEKLYAVLDYQGIARYQLGNDTNPPSVSISTPVNNSSFVAGGGIHISATAFDAESSIAAVEFYNDTTLLYTSIQAPYGFKWEHVHKGIYTLTAKAFDNNGNSTFSSPVHISVVPNKAPLVSIIGPVNNQTFIGPLHIHLEANASDDDGRVTKVEFFSGASLLRIEYKFPFSYSWKNVPAGKYTITAKATDNFGAVTNSAPINISVTQSKPAVVTITNPSIGKGFTSPANNTLRLKLAPNPTGNTLNIYTTGLQEEKAATISIISSSGVVVKTTHWKHMNQITQLDVSMLFPGVYTIKIISGDKMSYKQFIKL